MNDSRVYKRFPREFLLDVLDSDLVESDEIVGMSRWSSIHDVVFRHEGAFYKVRYSVGATECQDEEPWAGKSEVVCYEVRPTERTVRVFEYVED